jgi:hypothetical protein
MPICKFLGCKKYASFGFPNGKIERCKTHSEKDMVNKIKQKKCKCGKGFPIYNYTGLPAKFCSSCKEGDMDNVRNKKCKCGKGFPIFNFIGLPAEFCTSCKEEDMEIKNKKCKCGSGSFPIYNYIGLKAEFCSSCKEEDMEIKIKQKKCKCGKSQPNYNYIGLKAEFCSSCKEGDMDDVVNKKCKLENCPIFANPKYKGYCARCFGYMFPNDPLSAEIRSKSTETITTNCIKENFPDIGFKYDKQLQTNNCDCTIRRRPDAYVFINGTALCFENDENQHKVYKLQDENDRYNDLFMAFSGKWIYIRFNPHKFKKNNKTINPPLNSRLPTLVDEINKQILRINKEENEELVEIINLYCDE